MKFHWQTSTFYDNKLFIKYTITYTTYWTVKRLQYRGADKSLARPGRKHVRNARDFNDINMRAVIKFFSLQGKALKEIHAILTEILACFLPGQAKDYQHPCSNNEQKRAPASKGTEEFLLSCMFFSVYSVLNVPTGTLQLP